GRREQRIGDVLVVDALEEPPEADAIIVERVVGAILDRGDAPHHAITVARQEELAVGLIVEWVLLPIERVVDRRAKRRHPLRMSPLIEQLPGKIDEAAEIAARGDDGDDGAHDGMRNVAYALRARM